MTGDYSRMTFDPDRDYTRVRMQQGRIQLDADWNEQADIFLHLLRSQLGDVVGDSGARGDGFRISTDPPREEEPPREGERNAATAADTAAIDFQIGPGRFYVDGVACENRQATTFRTQPLAARDAIDSTSDRRSLLVYLDVWERELTAAQQPAIRDVALGGLDTAVRTQVVWRVGTLPLDVPDSPSDPQEAWQRFLRTRRDRVRLQARHLPDGSELENHLYRVQVRAASAEDSSAGTPAKRISFTWCRENGSIELPAVLEPPDASDAASDATSGTDGPRPTAFSVRVDDLPRSAGVWNEGDLVEIVDDLSRPGASSLGLFEIAGPPDLVRRRLTLAPPADAAAIEANDETHGGAFCLDALAGLRSPVLRRWDGQAAAAPGQWQTLERGVEVRFSRDGAVAAGDFWTIPSRAAIGGIEWPRVGDEPREAAPHGHVHHFAPLAVVVRDADRWRVDRDLRRRFDDLTEVAESRAAEAAAIRKLLEESLKKLRDELLEAFDKNRGLIRYQSEQDLEAGDVVALSYDEVPSIVRVDSSNAPMLLGVVLEKIEATGEAAVYRVATQGLVDCKVVGPVDPGDLLTPGATAGCARTVGFYIRPGTLIGKALSRHVTLDPDSRGTVRALLMTG